MAEKSPSLATQAYETIKENIMNLTYPPGMVLTEAMLTKELGMSRSSYLYCDPDAAGRRADRF